MIDFPNRHNAPRSQVSRAVFHIRHRDPSNDDVAHQCVRFSGTAWSDPDLIASYAAGARELLDATSAKGSLADVALPVFYLQRHALELAIKHVIECLIGLRRSDEEYNAATDADWRSILDAHAEEKDDSFTHKFHLLIAKADSLLKAQFTTLALPQEFRDAAAMIDAFELGCPDRARYERMSKPDRNGDTRSLARGRETVLRLGELQSLIECLLDGPLRCESLEDNTFLATLALEDAAMQQALQKRNRFAY